MRPIFFFILAVSLFAQAAAQPSQPSASAPQHFKLPATPKIVAWRGIGVFRR